MARRYHLLLADLQRLLQSRYDIDVPYRVEDFVSHDAELINELAGPQQLNRESLLVREHGDDLDVTLFLDESMLKDVAVKSWSTAWHGDGFDSYCTILEGVSHFLYLIWSAHHNLSVKPIELELQAEVDKFVFSALDTQPTSRRSQHKLLKRLFIDSQLSKSLSSDLRLRYQQANAGALSYCQWLTDNYDLRPDNRYLDAELARFYRSRGRTKFRRIERRCGINPSAYTLPQ